MKKRNVSSINPKAVIYARVSSKDQEKGGYSIPAQIKYLKEYAKENGYNVVEIFQEAETAKKAGRKKFEEMLLYLNTHKDVTILLVEKTDRIYRNFKDYVLLEAYDNLEIHLVKESMVMSKNSSSNAKLMHGFKLLLAKQYIDNLSEEVIKGQNEKAAEGIYPSKAPVGYRNVDDGHGKRIIVVDPKQAPFVRKAFELYATGLYSANTINNMLYKEGFRTDKGNKFSKRTFERMFKNIFYIGKFEYRGYICENAQHEALIDSETFNAIQRRLGRFNTERTHDIQFPYQGFIKCSVCGSMLSPELKRGKYIYYHCNDYHKKGCKKLSYVNQEKVDKAIAEILSRFKISDILLKEVMSVIKEMHIEKNKYQEHSCKKINEQISRLQKRIEQAYLDKCDGKIDEDFWKVQNRKWHSEKADLIEQLKRMNTADEKFYITCEQLLSFVKDAHKMFLNGSVEDKRFITQLVVSKCTYHAKKLDVELYPVFYSLLELPVLTGDKISTIEQSEMQITSTKKAPEGAEFVNGGNDEARTRDLMRDRHAL